MSIQAQTQQFKDIGKEKIGSLDGLKPTSTKFERPCNKIQPLIPPSPEPRKTSKPTSFKKLIPILLKFNRPCYPQLEKTRPLYDYGPTKFTRPTTSKDKLEVERAKCTLDLPKQGSPPKFSLESFKRWGSPYSDNCTKSLRSCSPKFTNLSSHMGSAFAIATKRSPTWQKSNVNIQKLWDGSSLVSRRMMQMRACAANARAPFPMSKARKLLFYQRVDKETFVEELEALKQAVANQAYHFQLHKVHIYNLQLQHHRLQEKVAAIESIDGSEAPRTGGKSRLSSKIAGMQTKIYCLENDISSHYENIQNLKYRYQVCLTREACVQRDMNAGHAQRVQKEYRVLTKLLKELATQNKKFLLLRDTILPEQKAWKKTKEDNIQEIKQKINEIDILSRQVSTEAYESMNLQAKAMNQVDSLIQEGKLLRAKLKYNREKNRKAQEEIWAKAYETCLLGKDNNRRNEKLRRLKGGK